MCSEAAGPGDSESDHYRSDLEPLNCIKILPFSTQPPQEVKLLQVQVTTVTLCIAKPTTLTMLSMSIVRLMVVALATMAVALPDIGTGLGNQGPIGPNGMEFSNSRPEYY